jgi:predicted ABC-type ATPase
MSSNGNSPDSSQPLPEPADDTISVWHEILGEIIAREKHDLKRERDLIVAEFRAQVVEKLAAIDVIIADKLEDLTSRNAERLAVVRDGAPGEPGPPGPAGPIGLAGERGEKGERGEPGAEGQRGEKGDVGGIGEQGPQGLQGARGEHGSPGEKGQRGEQGVPGRDGTVIKTGRGPPLTQEAAGTIYLDVESGDIYHNYKYDPDEPRDPAGKWTDGGGGDGGGGASATVATDLYNANGGAGSTTADELIAQHHAGDRIKQVEEKLAKGVPSNASVAQGGHVLPNGQYTPAREAVHERVLNQIFTPSAVAAAVPAPGEKPQLHVLGGRGGSGKSFITKAEGPVDASKALLLDSDKIKSLLPEYQGWNAALLHEEATHILNKADDLATHLKINTIHDGTLKTLGSVATRIAKYKAAGYDVNGYFVHTTPATAADRALGRFMRGGERGRYVPPAVILANKTNEESFDKLKNGFKTWKLYDNNGKAHKLVAEGRNP